MAKARSEACSVECPKCGAAVGVACKTSERIGASGRAVQQIRYCAARRKVAGLETYPSGTPGWTRQKRARAAAAEQAELDRTFGSAG